MRLPKSNDPLSGVVAEIDACCKDLQLQCFYAERNDSDRQPIVWDSQNNPDWLSFLAMAKALNVRIVYFVLSRFEESQIENAILESEETENQVESFRDRVGLICWVKLEFVHEGVFMFTK
jgi:hypothetical protein